MRGPTVRCPACNSRINAQQCLSDDPAVQPRHGDLTVCLYCAGVLKYNPDLSLRAMGNDEVLALPEDMKAGLRFARDLARRYRERKTEQN